MGFLSGGDDLKRSTQCYAGKPNVRHWFVYIRQVAPQIYANFKKNFKIMWGTTTVADLRHKPPNYISF